jgi:hypothetical protein
VEKELVALVEPPVVPSAGDDGAAFALVVQRTSNPAANDSGVAVLTDNEERIFQTIQPHIDPIERDVRSLALGYRQSYNALAFGAHENERGGAAELSYQCN